ncbi:FUSC family protein [Marinilongibacter aquaticus]|uniref:FUSC family protein n=1 Tax=Marinilongibacter aquaticus TaxID=2975157 RepID=UPI0021BD159F|nr:FUSC family membrane protein [Marinilongibacter aquaticus]UBM57746.1 FUSC family protein [Marinilongibacter aquaticus]
MEKYRQHLFSFEIVKGVFMTLSLVVPLYLGFHFHAFAEGFSFALGTMFTFLPNTDGSKRHRFLGMLISLVLCLFLVAVSQWLFRWSIWAFVPFFGFALFLVSILPVYGFRASMVAFSGNMALVMAFALMKNHMPMHWQLALIGLGGLSYMALASLTHWLFQNRNIALRLADCVENTAELLKVRHALRWDNNRQVVELDDRFIQLQVDLNAEHELLRELLFRKRKLGGHSNRTGRFLMIFVKMLDLYELSMASGAEIEELRDNFLDRDEITKPFREMSASTIVHLYALAEALRKGKELPLENSENAFEGYCEGQIRVYVDELKLPRAREGVFLLRNLLDLENNKWAIVQEAKRIYANILEGQEVAHPRDDRRMFISTQDYDWRTLKSNLNFSSAAFKHALRFTAAMLLGLLAGQLVMHQNYYWILLSIAVILRPNYGLTKDRAINRVFGTILGAVIALALTYIYPNKTFFGILAIPSTFVGFTFLQRNYKLAATFITISVLLLYGILVEDTLTIIFYRLIDTLIGALISFAAIFLLWPAWEEQSIRTSFIESIQALRSYLAEIDDKYQSKELPNNSYRLARKQAFFATSNLNAAFQRLTEEPESKHDHQAQVYAFVVLNQTFLNVLAALGTYIRNHETTPASSAYNTLVSHIDENLLSVEKALLHENYQSHYAEEETEAAAAMLEKKYDELQDIRNRELEMGSEGISSELRNRLQEGRLITNQLKWLYSLSQSMKQVTVYL